MQRCKDDIQREFYIKITKKFGWTKDVLINQLEAGAFERYMANQTNFDKAIPEKYRHQAKLAVKDEYSFDFLELGEAHSEKELERALLEIEYKQSCIALVGKILAAKQKNLWVDTSTLENIWVS